MKKQQQKMEMEFLLKIMMIQNILSKKEDFHYFLGKIVKT